MSWQNQVGPGWRPIVAKAVAAIEAVDGRISQVKEKFGGLRIYTAAHTEKNDKEIDNIVRAAEGEASRTCEACGKPGKQIVIKGWYKTACDVHKDGWDPYSFDREAS